MFENGETTTLKSRMFFSVILQKTLSYSFLIPVRSLHVHVQKNLVQSSVQCVQKA